MLSATGVALPLLTLGFTRPPEAPSIRGVWRTVEVTMIGPNGRTITNVQPNQIVMTATHYNRVEIHAEGPRPILDDVAKATADDLRATWGPVVAEAGTYEVSGNVITMRPAVAKNPAAMVRGAYRTYTFRLAGDTVWIIPERTEKGPVADALKIKAVRVE